MKNYVTNLFKILFVSLLLASCSEQELLIDELAEVEVQSSLSARINACSLDNYEAIDGKVLNSNGTNGESSEEDAAFYKLTQSRKGVAFYRAYARAYTDYANTGVVSNSTLDDLDLEPFRPFYGNIILAVQKSYNAIGTDTQKQAVRWSAITEYLSNMKSYGTYNETIRTLSNGWDGSTASHGSYTIVFEDGKVYLGKGADKSRMRTSAREKCANKPYRGDFQGTSASNYIARGYPTPSDSRQAYKEEAVRMYWDGFRDTQDTGNTLNLIKTKGERYIKEDGF